MRRLLPSILPLFVLFVSTLSPTAHAQDVVDPDATLKIAFDAWQTKWKAFVDVMTAARNQGQIQKGGELPEPVKAAQQVADEARDTVLAQFGTRDDLSPASYLLLARLHEANRDYASAAKSYEQSLEKGDPKAPALDTLGSLCIAAMNSKDDQLAAQWMKTLIAEEDRRDITSRNLSVRTSYYPRTLIALEDWETLGKLLETLDADEAPACKAAAATFGVVQRIHVRDLEGAKARLAAIRAEPAKYPDHQTWAVLAQLALQTHAGEFDAAAAAVRAYLAQPVPEGRAASAMNQNQRRYLAAIEPYLGKPAPKVRADHWVGGEVKGEDMLTALRGKVVVLDFWQPWCEPCRMAMPELIAAQAEHDGKLQVIGLCKIENYGYDVSEKRAVRPIEPKDYPAHVADFRADMQITYPLAIADTGENSQAYGVTGIPTLVVIDREGIVRYMSCGAGEPGLFQIAVEGVLAKGR